MKRAVKYLMLVIATLGFAGCATQPQLTSEEILQGTWKSQSSVAVYTIRFEEGQPQMNGHSSFSGKLLRISDVSWDGDVLYFTTYMASTDIKVLHENRIQDHETMVSQTIENKTGQLQTHTVVWKKVSATQENRPGSGKLIR